MRWGRESGCRVFFHGRAVLQVSLTACAAVAALAFACPQGWAIERAAQQQSDVPGHAAGSADDEVDLCEKYTDKMRARIEGLKKLREALQKSEKGPSGSLTGLVAGTPKVDDKLRKKIARSRSWLEQLQHAGAALGCDDIDIERELASPPGAALSRWRPKVETRP